jgi:hypothetical protein
MATVSAILVRNKGTDEVKQATAISDVRSASWIVSCSGAEGRLEVVFGVGALWAMKMASFWGSLRQTKMMRRCVRKRERERSDSGANRPVGNPKRKV